MYFNIETKDYNHCLLLPHDVFGNHCCVLMMKKYDKKTWPRNNMHPFVAWSPDLTLLGNQCFLKSRLNLMDTWNPWVINPNFQRSYSALAVFVYAEKSQEPSNLASQLSVFQKGRKKHCLVSTIQCPEVWRFSFLLVCLFACLLVCLFACLLKSRLHLAAPLNNSRTGLEILKK